MANWEEIRELLRKRPFQPFRVHLTDGRSFTIEYPELNLVNETYMAVGIPVPNDPDPFAEYVVDFDIDAIASVEVLATPSPWQPR